MTLYHGSNQVISCIDLTIGSQYKDFGRGFYLTPNKETAIRMAMKKAKLFGGTPMLMIYDLDETGLSALKLKRFPEIASVEWFKFIDDNRNRKILHPVHHYDIVVGPIADDGVVLQLDSVRNGFATPDQAAALLQDKYLDQQYCFCTEVSLKVLTLYDSVQL